MNLLSPHTEPAGVSPARKLGLAQIDVRVGDLEGNLRRIRAAADALPEAQVVLTPELSICGYPPRDLLLEPGFVEACAEAVHKLAVTTTRGPALLVGAPWRVRPATEVHPGLQNVVLWLEHGEIRAMQAKSLLPAQDVFWEPRWFLPATSRRPIGGAGVLICEDLWDEPYDLHPSAELLDAGARSLWCISASPFRAGVLARRLRESRRVQAGRPLVYLNLVGAQDELIFDGGSFVLDGRGQKLLQLPRFSEAVAMVDLDAPGEGEVTEPDPIAALHDALVLGIRDFSRKNGIRKAVLGSSGGVDSAVVAALAVAALGPEHVTTVAMPSRYSDPRSTTVAQELAGSLGAGFSVVPIDGLHQQAESALSGWLDDPSGVTGENVQARLRMLILMSVVNRYGGMLLNTSNKTELTLGYGTLYADMAGTLSVLGDVTKPDVYALARYINRDREVIPSFILDRPPSAELRPDQVDPFDYPRISPMAEALVAGTTPVGPLDELPRLRRLYRGAEHKRWQAGIILKVSERAFGTGRMMPVTRG